MMKQQMMKMPKTPSLAARNYAQTRSATVPRLGVWNQGAIGLGASPTPLSASKGTGSSSSTTGVGQGSGNRQQGVWNKGVMPGKNWPGYRRRRWGWLGQAGSNAPPLSSDWVAWAQACLGRVVGPWVPQDGVMGPETVRAIQMFQTQQQLTVTGLLDGGTISALQAACSAPAAGPPPPPVSLPVGPPPPLAGPPPPPAEAPPPEP